MPRRDSPYNYRYQREREAMLALRLPCQLRLVCDGALANSADHDPPLSKHAHVNDSGCCRLRPACRRCQQVQAMMMRVEKQLRRPVPPPSREW